MVRHVVLIKPRTIAQVRKALEVLGKEASRISGLASCLSGQNSSEYCGEYTVFISMDFVNTDALAAWHHSPAHTPIRDCLMEHSEMIVLDYLLPPLEV